MQNLAEQGEGFSDGYSGLRVLSIARLSHQKGLDIALPAAANLKKKGS